MNSINKNFAKIISKIEKTALDKQYKYKPAFHLSPPIGWLNDPNGLCRFRGYYHVFFQYSPFDEIGGIKLWGHYKSGDLVNWEYLPPAIYPDQIFDFHGVYSGTAFIENEKMYLYYTGNVIEPGNNDLNYKGRQQNTCLIISEDGENFSQKTLLMTNADYPHMSCHVRDPKVFYYNSLYCMLLGARSKDDCGKVMVFTSYDKIRWEHANTISTKEKFGYMWECPDFISISNKQFLCVCPQGIRQDGFKYNNVHQSGYFPLEGDILNKYSLGEFIEFDKGFDFYAPQTFVNESNELILIGWMGLPDTYAFYQNYDINEGWQHMLTVPRVLSERDGKLLQKPIKQLQGLRKKHFSKHVMANDCFEIPDVFELLMHFDGINDLEIIIKDSIKLEFSQSKNLFILSFIDGGAGRTKRCTELDNLNDLHILFDKSCLEVFINDGETVFTSRHFCRGKNVIQIRGDKFSATVDIWEMGSYSFDYYFNK